MPPFTYRLRFLIPRDRLPHTAEDEPHVIALPPVGPIELHLRRGTGSRSDNLVLSKRDIASADQTLEEALAAKQALMRAGLIANVPMLFGNDASSTTLAPQLVDHMRATTGLTPRPDVHGIDILDEADGPTFALRFEAEARVGTPIDTFLDTLTESLGTKQPSFMLNDRLALAIEVFMAASTERTPRARFLDFVTVVEVLAEQRPSSAEAITIVEAALAQLKERRGDLDDAEARSLEGSLARLRNRSISQSIRDIAAGLDPDEIDGYREGDIDTFLGLCYNARSLLVHQGAAPNESDVAQLAGSLFFLLRHMLIRRVDG